MDRNHIYIELYEKYRDKYAELLDATEREPLEVKYARGGEVLHRGYFCPSPVFDIVIGGANRGRLLKTQKTTETADFSYFFKKDKLVRVDSYAVFEGKGRTLYSREFILRDGDIEVAPLYHIYRQGDVKLAGMTICEYVPQHKQTQISGKLLRYIYSFGYPYHAEEMGMSFSQLLSKSLIIREETYSYNSDGLLVCSTLEEIFRDFIQMSAYVFYHNDKGELVSYKYLNGNKLDPGADYYLHAIPKSKQRIV